jgi:hypothetical protein
MRLHYVSINAIIRITNKAPGCLNPGCSFSFAAVVSYAANTLILLKFLLFKKKSAGYDDLKECY